MRKVNLQPTSEINRKMKKGEKTVIAEQTGFSVSHVTNVLAGRRNNEAILRLAHKMTYRRK